MKKKIKIQFLGTGTSQGVPMLLSDHPVNQSIDSRDKRRRSSVLVSWDEFSYLIDCGPDFREQVLRSDIKKIHGIFFTHEHSDHIAGLDDIRPFCYQMGSMPIYGKDRVVAALEKRYDYIFKKENRYPGAAQVFENRIDDTPLKFHGVQITPINVWHGNLDIYGYRFQDFAYLTDVKQVVAEERKKLKNLEILVVSAIRNKPHPTHFNLDEALAFIKEIGPKKAYITHISHLLGFHEEVSKKLPDNVFLAYDGLEVFVG